MATLDTSKIIRRVRQRLEVSQEGLSRLLNATKGAVQHWERGRNKPDLARLIALRQLCPPGAERKALDALIRQMQAQVAPLSREGQPGAMPGAATAPRGPRGASAYPQEGLLYLRRENNRLQRQVEKLQTTLQRRNEQLRILEDLATELQREMADLRASVSGKVSRPQGPSRSAAD